MNRPYLTHEEQIEALTAKCALLAASLRQVEAERRLEPGSAGSCQASYTFGTEFSAPFAVTLVINTEKVGIERFRADLPKITAKLKKCIKAARNEASRQGDRR